MGEPYMGKSLNPSLEKMDVFKINDNDNETHMWTFKENVLANLSQQSSFE